MDISTERCNLQVIRYSNTYFFLENLISNNNNNNEIIPVGKRTEILQKKS